MAACLFASTRKPRHPHAPSPLDHALVPLHLQEGIRKGSATTNRRAKSAGRSTNNQQHQPTSARTSAPSRQHPSGANRSSHTSSPQGVHGLASQQQHSSKQQRPQSTSRDSHRRATSPPPLPLEKHSTSPSRARYTKDVTGRAGAPPSQQQQQQQQQQQEEMPNNPRHWAVQLRSDTRDGSPFKDGGWVLPSGLGQGTAAAAGAASGERPRSPRSPRSPTRVGAFAHTRVCDCVCVCGAGVSGEWAYSPRSPRPPTKVSGSLCACACARARAWEGSAS